MLGSHFLAGLGGLFLLLMLAQITLDVALEYFFDAPIEGNLEIVSVYYMVGVAFLPLALVELRHEHIRVELIVRFLSRRSQNYLYAFGSLVTAVFFGLLTYQTLLDALHALEIREKIMGSILVTIWPSRFILPASFLMMLLAALLHALRAIADPEHFEPSEAPERD